LGAVLSEGWSPRMSGLRLETQRELFILLGEKTAQIYVGSSDIVSGLPTVTGKHCLAGSRGQHRKSMSELPTCVGTSDGSALLTLAGTAGTRARQSWRRDFRRLSGLPTRARAELNVGTSDSRRDFRRSQFSRSTSGVPTHVGSSDTRSHRG